MGFKIGKYTYNHRDSPSILINKDLLDNAKNTIRIHHKNYIKCYTHIHDKFPWLESWCSTDLKFTIIEWNDWLYVILTVIGL